MSKLRTCPGCKWQFPRSFNNRNCKFCGTALNDKFCSKCNELRPIKDFYGANSECSRCKRIRDDIWIDANREKTRDYRRKLVKRRREEAEALMESWVSNPLLQFKPMTEQEWYKACSYFGGCAFCNNSHIETRQFFIPFKEGGRYSPWNVFPMCGDCAVRIVPRTTNPFLFMDSCVGTAHSRYKIPKARLKQLREYFEMKVSEAIDNSRSSV